MEEAGFAGSVRPNDPIDLALSNQSEIEPLLMFEPEKSLTFHLQDLGFGGNLLIDLGTFVPEQVKMGDLDRASLEVGNYVLDSISNGW